MQKGRKEMSTDFDPLAFWQHYATTKSAICALWKYSAWQFQSAVQYIRTLLLKMPFENKWSLPSIYNRIFVWTSIIRNLGHSFRFRDAEGLVNYSINCSVRKETHDSIFEQIYEIFHFSSFLKSCTLWFYVLLM